MADLVTIAATAALTQFVGPMFKHLGEQALERAKQVASTAAAQLKAVGREPQPVEPKLLVPLVQAASLETDETLAEKWATLLANAADPVQRVTVQPGYITILRELTLHDALVLDKVFKATMLELIPSEEDTPFIETASIKEALGSSVPSESLYIAVDNLSRMRLCLAMGLSPQSKSAGIHSSIRGIGPGKGKIGITHLGYDFMQAVTPPAP